MRARTADEPWTMTSLAKIECRGRALPSSRATVQVTNSELAVVDADEIGIEEFQCAVAIGVEHHIASATRGLDHPRRPAELDPLAIEFVGGLFDPLVAVRDAAPELSIGDPGDAQECPFVTAAGDGRRTPHEQLVTTSCDQGVRHAPEVAAPSQKRDQTRGRRVSIHSCWPPTYARSSSRRGSRRRRGQPWPR